MKAWMKKACALGTALLLLLACTACVRLDATVKVNADGTVDIRVMSAVSDALAALGDNPSFGLTEQEIREYQEKGFTYESYSDEKAGYSGYILSCQNFKPQPAEGGDASEGLSSVLDGDFYSIRGRHVTIDLAPFSAEESAEILPYLPAISTYGGYMDFHLELPVKPTAHNAASVSEDGKTLTWDLTKFDADDTIHVEFDYPLTGLLLRYWPVIAVALAGLLLIAGAVVLLIVVKKKKKAGRKAIEPAEEPGPVGE